MGVALEVEVCSEAAAGTADPSMFETADTRQETKVLLSNGWVVWFWVTWLWSSKTGLALKEEQRPARSRQAATVTR